jgi:hypothetical protein
MRKAFAWKGSNIALQPTLDKAAHGEHSLKGIDGAWRAHELATPASRQRSV